MSNYALTAAFDSSVPEPSVRFVLVALADQANDDSLCWPAVGSLADRTGLSKRTVQKALLWLVEHAHISYAMSDRSRGGMPGPGSTTRYVIHPRACPVRAAKREISRRDREPVLPGTEEKTDGCSPDTRATTAPVQPLHPCNVDGGGVQPATGRGAAVAPEPSVNPHRTQKRARTRASSSFSPVIPDDLHSDVRTALVQWLTFKQQKRQSYVETGWTAFLSHLRKFTPAAVVAAIEESIRLGWAGLFPERHFGAANSSQADLAEKKSKGAAAEPAWDWRALFESQYSRPADGLWADQIPDVRRELSRLHRKKNEGGSAAA